MVRVTLGSFACSGIETHLGSDLSAGVRTALFHYVGKLKTGRRPVAFPHFLAEAPPEPKVALELTIDAETEAMLEREALRERTTMSQLVAHAVLVYLAELEFLGAAPRGATSPR
jgi:hypothetical protein